MSYSTMLAEEYDKAKLVYEQAMAEREYALRRLMQTPRSWIENFQFVRSALETYDPDIARLVIRELI